MTRKKIDISTLLAKKRAGEKITMLTAYDYPTAKLLDEAGIDTLLVGDSLANVVLGYPDTLPVSMDEMLMLTKAVVRGAKYAMVIGDMPFMSYNTSERDAIVNAGRFLKEAGTQAVKLEGGGQVANTLSALVRAGIPCVGHLGLTPQTAGMIGGYRVQGATALAAKQILDDALKLQDSGAFMLVLECVPDRVAALISETVNIPVIGIGAGSGCDGQVLVVNDMLGYPSNFTPKFVKHYADLGDKILSAAKGFKSDVEQGGFPAAEHCFTIPDEEYEKLRGKTG